MMMMMMVMVMSKRVERSTHAEPEPCHQIVAEIDFAVWTLELMMMMMMMMMMMRMMRMGQGAGLFVMQ
jgi:hypothetical protein